MANWAITIGINSYRYLQPLQFAMRDADAVQQFFSNELGFQQVYHFTESAPSIPQDYDPELDSTSVITEAHITLFAMA
ncbi:MAG: caspase family protein [Leptolyngbyaceae cyanobacterium MAG.088]|nr:caspase family protein [Leptolyngbyaceae cyanobacterium MAG.088]